MLESNASSKTAENGVGMELAFTRVFDAPRELVFKVWTDPKHVAQWWGPHGFTNPRCELDVRPGGAMRIDMRGPDGRLHLITGTYQEVVAPERIVFTERIEFTGSALDEAGNPLFELLNTVTFTERGGKTTLTVHTRVVQANAQAAQFVQGMEAGWIQTLERLETCVAQAAQGQKS
jgi:uncharacterized protein YndB with AHSA1/START domain